MRTDEVWEDRGDYIEPIDPNDAILIERVNTGEYNDGNAGATHTIDWTKGNCHKITRDQSTVLSFTDPLDACHLQLRFIHAANANAYTVSFPNTVKYPGGTTITFTDTSGAVDIVNFWFDGTYYYAVASTNFLSPPA